MTDDAPQFTNTKAWHVETRTATSAIVGGPTLKGHVSRQEFVADEIHAMWQRIDGGKWTLFECKVSGRLVLKHGGQLSTKTRLNLHLANLPHDRRPGWVNTWLTDNGPTPATT